MLHCSIRHLERLMGEGLPFIPIGGRKKVFSAESVSRWLMSREECIAPAKAKQRMPKPASNAYTEYCAEMAAKREARRLRSQSGNKGAQ